MMNDSTRTIAVGSEPAKLEVVTGEPRVDEALALLAGLDELPDTAHIEAYEHVYRRLHGILGELDTAGPHPASHDLLASSDSGDSSDGQAEQA
jgi:hypothetical protein